MSSAGRNDAGPRPAEPDVVGHDRPAALAGCDQPLAAAYDVALLDLDGVVYIGPAVVEGASAALAAARSLGMRTAFVTNNASRTPGGIAAHLRELGIPAAASDVVTSAQAAARLLRDRLPPGSAVLVAGGEGLRQEVLAAGLAIVGSADDRPAAVVQGYTPDADYAMLAEATLAVNAGAWWVAANRDATMPSPRGRLPGNGALVALVAAATGREPVDAGKPEWALHRESVERTAACHPLVVGDRLDTDILGAVRGGTDSLLVFTGVIDPVDVLHAPGDRRPTYLAAGLAGLLHPHHGAAVVVTDGRATADSGGWRAVATGRRVDLALTGVGGRGTGRASGQAADDIDALRALCAAVWALAGDEAPRHLELTGRSSSADDLLARLDLDSR